MCSEVLKSSEVGCSVAKDYCSKLKHYRIIYGDCNVLLHSVILFELAIFVLSCLVVLSSYYVSPSVTFEIYCM